MVHQSQDAGLAGARPGFLETLSLVRPAAPRSIPLITATEASVRALMEASTREVAEKCLRVSNRLRDPVQASQSSQKRMGGPFGQQQKCAAAPAL